MTDEMTPTFWKRCSSCKKEIGFRTKYYLCSVSTCRHERTGLRFCSVACWDAHLPYANHRSAFAEEAMSPSRDEFQATVEAAPLTRAPTKKRVDSSPAPQATVSKPVSGAVPPPETDTLVVVSKVKQLIRDQSGFNTSECCVDELTKKVVLEALKGIEKARAAGRKTVMGRDIS